MDNPNEFIPTPPNPADFAGFPNPPASEIEDHMPLVYAHYLMLRKIRSWGLILFGIGLFHLFASGILNAPWEIILVVVGLAAMLFKSSVIFIVYAVGLIWAVVPNIATFHPLWMLLGIGQLYMAIRITRDFIKFSPMEKVFLHTKLQMIEEDQVVLNRAAQTLPRFGLFFGLVSAFGIVLLFLASALISGSRYAAVAMPAWFPYLESLLIALSGLGFAASLAALLSNFPQKGKSIVGLITSLISIVVQLAVLL